VSCDTTSIVGANISGEGDLTLWKVIDASVRGEYDVTTTYEIKISAPAKQNDEKKETRVALH
jgi:hypothetical protein